jgi:hypothetical protein
MKLVGILLLTALSLMANTLTINDPYQGAFPGDAQNNGDVKGLLRLFDIESIQFAQDGSAKIQMSVRLNYNNGDASFGQFSVGGDFTQLNVGDVLFSIGNSVKYGIALHTHDGLTAGNLYAINHALTASDVLHSACSSCYNPNELVWMDSAGASNIGNGSVLTLRIYPAGAEVQAGVTFHPDPAFLTDLANGLNVHFAAATCANDFLNGSVQSHAPEPGTLVLAGGALIAFGLWKRRPK